MQRLKRSRTLTKGKEDLQVTNGTRIFALVVGILSSPTGLELELEDCYYLDFIFINIISISCLEKIRFSYVIKNKSCSISYNDMFCSNALVIKQFISFDLELFIYNINTKRINIDGLNPICLYRCLLGPYK